MKGIIVYHAVKYLGDVPPPSPSPQQQQWGERLAGKGLAIFCCCCFSITTKKKNQAFSMVVNNGDLLQILQLKKKYESHNLQSMHC